MSALRYIVDGALGRRTGGPGIVRVRRLSLDLLVREDETRPN